MIGIILSSKTVADELTIDFGNITPSELPLSNKNLLHFQIQELKQHCNDIYLTRNDDSNKIDCEYNYKEYTVDKDLSLINLIFKILVDFKSQDIFFLYGDTLIEYPKLQYNHSTMFSIEDVNIPYPNWHVLPNKTIMSGSFVVDKSLNKSILDKNLNSINDLLNFIYKESNSVQLNNDKHLDFGQFHTYYNSKKNFLETRDFNNIKIISQNFIEKSSKDISKMIFEFNWLKKAHEIFPSLIPIVKNINITNSNLASYSLEYYNNSNLSDIFVKGNQSSNIKERIILTLIHTLKKIQASYTDEKNSNFIIDKLETREIEILEISNEFLMKKEVINLIDQQKIFFKNKKFHTSIMHGDYCFSNILYNMRDNTLKLIDPRGFLNKEEGFSFYGPYVYDYFKLAHSYVGKYDFIICGQSPKNFDKNEIKENLIYFSEISGISQELLISGMINLFLTMLPLHYDNKKRQEDFLCICLILDKLK